METAVLTISDGCHQGEREDLSGAALRQEIEGRGWSVSDWAVVPDEVDSIRGRLQLWLDRPEIDLIVSTGGTGLSPRDVTPEAVAPLLDKEAPGLAELMRLRGLEKTDFAALSRSLAGVMGSKLILCLPGSPKGAVESLQAVAKLIPHAVDIAQGRTRHK